MSYQTWIYEKLAKPVFFKIDPELTHDLATMAGIVLGSNPITRFMTGIFFRYQNKMLKNSVAGITFENPVGLAAGFDKNARLLNILPEVGFGFMELGSVTAQPNKGNPRPRLFRLPKDNAIIVHYGLCNDGADVIAKRLKHKHSSIPFGVSIAKTNDKTICGEASIEDYYDSYQKLKNVGDYIAINISCPNAGDGRSFEDPVLLKKLLDKIGKPKKPVFLKISPDISEKNLDAIIALAKQHHLTGFILTNLTHNRNNLKSPKSEYEGKRGSISGKPAQQKSIALVRSVYRKTRGEFTIIAVGGIFNAEDAYAAIKSGASLVQIITGMIYRGPGVISEINRGLVKLMKQDGFKNISEVIGSDV